MSLYIERKLHYFDNIKFILKLEYVRDIINIWLLWVITWLEIPKTIFYFFLVSCHGRCCCRFPAKCLSLLERWHSRILPAEKFQIEGCSGMDPFKSRIENRWKKERAETPRRKVILVVIVLTLEASKESRHFRDERLLAGFSEKWQGWRSHHMKLSEDHSISCGMSALLNWDLIFCIELVMLFNYNIDQCIEPLMSLEYKDLLIITGYDPVFWSRN